MTLLAARDRLQRKIADLTRRQDNLLRQAQTGDPDDPFTQGLRRAYDDLNVERRAAVDLLAELDAADESDLARPDPTASRSWTLCRIRGSASTVRLSSSRVDAVRAPGGIRTHTVGGLSTVSLPLEYRGRLVGARGSRVLQAATGPLDVQVGLPLRL